MKDDIKNVLKGMEYESAPDFLENEVMSSVANQERKRTRYISFTTIMIYTGLSALLLFVSLALYYYVPDMLWLYEVKVSVAVLLLAYTLYTAASWLPAALQSLMKKE